MAQKVDSMKNASFCKSKNHLYWTKVLNLHRFRISGDGQHHTHEQTDVGPTISCLQDIKLFCLRPRVLRPAGIWRCDGTSGSKAGRQRQKFQTFTGNLLISYKTRAEWAQIHDIHNPKLSLLLIEAVDIKCSSIHWCS